MTRYGHPGGPARRDDEPGAALFALARAWAAGIVVLVATEYVQATVVYEHVATPERMETFGGRLLLIHIPDAVCLALATWAACRAHREPFRRSPPRHLAAAVAVPVAAQLLNMAVQWEHLAAEGLLMSNVVTAVGCAAGYLVSRLRDDV
ncbi:MULTISPECIES: hypothetical protein [unclassified Streptomyces]|uniref:hypothetical protein n=1 Tax=Streptomyces TaxID=1883 RepID=UPI0001C1C011|nr:MULTISPECIES: hypothetical protein [unclassified Streptomyces]AEN12084.1 conserved hypothetical protein [Streptomyces sp. SirexAA-E]MYR68207.1 hypothetical protein [Streptomyces sp. SID4939]MYS03231.1 hypothetical protein [Streptomyces sp. SID4940]MYT66875.1 hypothetical protein [Streptomyces sp. SID8357]MYT88348.1 hypothetical protein [Streptomyces sp. SID8360]